MESKIFNDNINFLKSLQYHKHKLYNRTHLAHVIQTMKLVEELGGTEEEQYFALLHSVFDQENSYGNQSLDRGDNLPVVVNDEVFNGIYLYSYYRQKELDINQDLLQTSSNFGDKLRTIRSQDSLKK